jgi:outer membrane lipoprotein LolB
MRLWVLWAVAPLLGACASLATRAPAAPSLPDLELPGAWEARRGVLQGWSGYEIRGRLAVARGDDGFSGQLRWIRRPSVTRLELEGPLGVGGAHFDFTDGTDTAALEQALGLPIPVASLRYWLLGVPDPGLLAEESLEPGGERLAILRQGGWEIAYPLYSPVLGTRLELPQRIEVRREGLRLRLWIDAWQGASMDEDRPR